MYVCCCADFCCFFNVVLVLKNERMSLKRYGCLRQDEIIGRVFAECRNFLKEIFLNMKCFCVFDWYFKP